MRLSEGFTPAGGGIVPCPDVPLSIGLLLSGVSLPTVRLGSASGTPRVWYVSSTCSAIRSWRRSLLSGFAGCFMASSSWWWMAGGSEMRTTSTGNEFPIACNRLFTASATPRQSCEASPLQDVAPNHRGARRGVRRAPHLPAELQRHDGGDARHQRCRRRIRVRRQRRGV